jgi:hypothetical protein
MKYLLAFLFSALLYNSCTTKKTTEQIVASKVPTDDTVGNFFPVTSYLKGEIYGIKNNGITPIKKTIIAGKTDSSWLKLTEIDSALSDFLTPIIDTANLKNTYEEKRFLDQTLNVFTFTYAPRNVVENNFAFKNWDVYVDPETSKVKRIYLVKKLDDNTTKQLTWISGKYCTIRTIKNTGGNDAVIKEEKISWSFEE